MISAETILRRRALTLSSRSARVATTVGLGVFVATAAVVHATLALRHTSPRLFPDEYIYAAISRSIGHGHLSVRGRPADFPSLLQPLLAAPAWRFMSAWHAFRALQIGNAVAASLAIVPVWILGRKLELRRIVILLACLLAVSLPTLEMVTATITDFVAYPLALGAIAAAVYAIDAPSKRRQVTFLALALLATLGRVNYFVLVPAYLAAAVVVDRKRALRKHAPVWIGIAPAVLAITLALTGYYSVSWSRFDTTFAKWFGLQLFLLVSPIAVALTPGAVAAFLRPEGRAQTAYGTIVLAFAPLLIFQATVPAADEGRFKERYLFALLPLVAIGFGTYLRNGRRHGWIVLATAAALIIAAARLPFSPYVANARAFDAQTMTAASLALEHLGRSNGSLVIAFAITTGALLALAVARRQVLGPVALVYACALSVACLAGAVYVDRQLNVVEVSPTWVDDAARGAPVTAIATPASGKIQLLRTLYWNASIDREVAFTHFAQLTDSYSADPVQISRDGYLTNVKGYFVWDSTGSQATFWNARSAAKNRSLTLYHSVGSPRFRLLVESQLASGWLSPYSVVHAWPRSPAPSGSAAAFTLSLPRNAPHPSHIQVRGKPYVVRPGGNLRFTCTSPGRSVAVVIYGTDPTPDRFDRPVTVRLTRLQITGPPERPVGGCAAVAG